MSKIDIKSQGINARGPNGNIWIGDQGPNTFTFTNRAGGPVTIVVWTNDAPGDHAASFVAGQGGRQPKVTYSLAKDGDKVTLSLVNKLSGGWSALVNRKTKLSPYGQIENTWGEFTSGEYATVDISRLINMSGTQMSASTNGGCTTDMNKCVFVCRQGNTCWQAGSYKLQNCQNNSQPGATIGQLNGNDEGGCQGWKNGGHVDISIGK
jgi:hypothetical protein